MLYPRVTYEVKPLFHDREPGRTSYRVIRRVTIGNSDVATMEIARYAHEHDAQIVASRLRLSAHDEEHDHYPSAEEEVDVVTFASEGRTAPGERFEGHGERECGEHRTTGPRAWCPTRQEWRRARAALEGDRPMADSDPHAETRALAPEQAARAVHDAIECIDAAVELLVYARTLRGVAHLRQARTLLEQALQRRKETNNLWDGS